jgi:4-hydroxyphenylpyruvate dioxygenase-like putative hemolysin
MTKYEINKKWRKKHPLTYQKGKARYYRKSEKSANNKQQRWTLKDINLVLNKNKNGRTDSELAKLLGRSVMAIQIKRIRLNKTS